MNTKPKEVEVSNDDFKTCFFCGEATKTLTPTDGIAGVYGYCEKCGAKGGIRRERASGGGFQLYWTAGKYAEVEPTTPPAEDDFRTWEELTAGEKEALLSEWEQEEGSIEHAVAHLTASPEDLQAAVTVLEELKWITGANDWEETPLDNLLTLMQRTSAKRRGAGA